MGAVEWRVRGRCAVGCAGAGTGLGEWGDRRWTERGSGFESDQVLVRVQCRRVKRGDKGAEGSSIDRGSNSTCGISLNASLTQLCIAQLILSATQCSA